MGEAVRQAQARTRASDDPTRQAGTSCYPDTQESWGRWKSKRGTSCWLLTGGGDSKEQPDAGFPFCARRVGRWQEEVSNGVEEGSAKYTG